jgi:hypothetical protein
MDPRDRPLLLPDGAACTACGAAVPTGRIRVLARRDDVAFVEVTCPDCGSEAVGLLTLSQGTDDPSYLDVAADAMTSAPGRVAPDRATLRPISTADVEAIRADLAAWDGDLVGWLDSLDAPGAGRRGSVVDR